MPVAKRFGPQENERQANDPKILQAAGLSLKELARRAKHPPIGQLEIARAEGEAQRYILDKEEWTIGRGSECDIPMETWFGPRIAARIRRKGSEYILIPEGGFLPLHRVQVNDQTITEARPLQDGDRVSVGDLQGTFYFRPLV